MDFLFSLGSAYSLLGTSNYKVINSPNIYNFIIDMIERENCEDGEKDIIQSIKKNMGITFWEGFKSYVLKKYQYDDSIVKLVSSS